MRGKDSSAPDPLPPTGITPAYAGKSPRPMRAGPPAGDHPRVCGEKSLIRLLKRSCWGSPPRMRGKGSRPVASRMAAGITPAYAGKRRTANRPFRCLWDHPRVCGEKITDLTGITNGMGSPPRMRGKGTGNLTDLRCFGITPAYAGKSLFKMESPFCLRDHPRVCGEKYLFDKQFASCTGSPPRMRGKVRCRVSACCPQGITPAYAGKRSPRSRRPG